MTEPLAIPTWNEIVGDLTGDAAVDCVASRLRSTKWLASVGKPSLRDGEVVRVHDWPAALRMFTEGKSRAHMPREGTGTSGTLNAPFWLLLTRLDEDAALDRCTANAATRVLDSLPGDHYAAVAPISERLCELLGHPGDPFHAEATIGDYIHEYIRMLVIEIYAGDTTAPRCSYFRDLLGWFLSGLLPCGWEGEWPAGHNRIL